MRATIVLICLLLLPGPLLAQDQRAAATPLPGSIPIFPLPDIALFPHSTQPFHIFEQRYRDMMVDALAGDSIIGMVMLRAGFEADYEGRPPIHELGTAGRIVRSERLPDGRYNLLLEGFTKFRVLGEDQSRSYRLAQVEAVPDVLLESDREELRERRLQLEGALRSAVPGVRIPGPEVPAEEMIDAFSLALPLQPSERMILLQAEGPIQRALRLIRRLRGGPPSSI